MKKEITEWIVAITVGLLFVWLVVTFAAESHTIRGDSMDPTLKDGQHVMVNILGYKVGNIKKGNIIVFHANQSDDYVKRVIDVPGDSVTHKKNQLYVNGKKVNESYLDYNEKYKQGEYITGSLETKDLLNTHPNSNAIPKNRYLVSGDNREVSKDSRAFGLTDKQQIAGKVSLRFWLLNNFKFNFNPDKWDISLK